MFHILYKDKLFGTYNTIEEAKLNKNNMFPLSMQKDLKIISNDELKISHTKE